MDQDYLTLDIAYNVNERKVDITGDVKKESHIDLITNFLRLQMGKGEDKSKVDIRDIYNISLRWYPHNDRFEAYSNTGNMALREGILRDTLEILSEESAI